MILAALAMVIVPLEQSTPAGLPSGEICRTIEKPVFGSLRLTRSTKVCLSPTADAAYERRRDLRIAKNRASLRFQD